MSPLAPATVVITPPSRAIGAGKAAGLDGRQAVAAAVGDGEETLGVGVGPMIGAGGTWRARRAKKATAPTRSNAALAPATRQICGRELFCLTASLIRRRRSGRAGILARRRPNA